MRRFGRQRLKAVAGSRALALARRWAGDGFDYMRIEFPPARRGPRYGHGRPPHARIEEILARDEDRYRATLEAIARHASDLGKVPLSGDPAREACYLNRWLPGLDAAALYAFLRDRDPAAYVEVGSGMSTLFARRAIDDGGLRTTITSIDPVPREWGAEDAADERITQPLELLDLSVFERVKEGDVVFLDGSHLVLANSDATVFFLEVLPELPGGVLVGVHDVLWPEDYLPEWTDYNWSEQYLAGVHLLAEGGRTRCELAANYVGGRPDLASILDPMWDGMSLPADARRGFALWLTTTNRG